MDKFTEKLASLKESEGLENAAYWTDLMAEIDEHLFAFEEEDKWHYLVDKLHYMDKLGKLFMRDDDDEQRRKFLAQILPEYLKQEHPNLERRKVIFNALVNELLENSFDLLESIPIRSLAGVCIMCAPHIEPADKRKKLIVKTSASLLKFMKTNSGDLASIRYLIRILTHLLFESVSGVKYEQPEGINFAKHLYNISKDIRDVYSNLIEYIVKEHNKKGRFDLLKILIDAEPKQSKIYRLWDLVQIAFGVTPIASLVTPMIPIAKWISADHLELSEEQVRQIVLVCLKYLDNSDSLDIYYAAQVLQIIIMVNYNKLSKELAYQIVSSTISARNRDCILRSLRPRFGHKNSGNSHLYILLSFYAANKIDELHKLIDRFLRRMKLELSERERAWCDYTVIHRELIPKVYPGRLSEIPKPPPLTFGNQWYLDCSQSHVTNFHVPHHHVIGGSAASNLLSSSNPNLPDRMFLSLLLSLHEQAFCEELSPKNNDSIFPRPKCDPKKLCYETETLHYYVKNFVDDLT